ncbi:MAG: hypothetical protein ACK6D1_06160 [Planctomycetota bacterium]
MQPRILATVLSLLLAGPAAAQQCFTGDFGTRLALNTVDTVYPIQPIGFAFPFAGATYTNIHVNDHGFVQLSNNGTPAPLTSGSAALYTPTVANFVAGGPKIAPLYCDMELTGGGECFIKSTATTCTVTWWNVRSYGIAAPRFSFQLQLDVGGLIRFVYGPGVTNNSTFGGVSDNGICGVTPAGGVTAPVSLDLSVGGTSTNNTTFENWAAPNGFDMASNTLLFVPSNPGFSYTLLGAPANCSDAQTYGLGCDGLTLASVGLPTLGNANYTLRAATVPAASPLAFFGYGTIVQNPGLPLGPLGMTGCEAYTSLDIGLFSGSLTTGGASTTTLAVPSSPTLVGVVLSAQALALTTNNPFGLAASNGVRILVGQGY